MNKQLKSELRTGDMNLRVICVLLDLLGSESERNPPGNIFREEKWPWGPLMILSREIGRTSKRVEKGGQQGEPKGISANNFLSFLSNLA